MTKIVSNKAATYIQNLLALALDNVIKQKKPEFFEIFVGETFARLKRYNWAFRPSRPAWESHEHNCFLSRML